MGRFLSNAAMIRSSMETLQVVSNVSLLSGMTLDLGVAYGLNYAHNRPRWQPQVC
jgi:hypothetical protein